MQNQHLGYQRSPVERRCNGRDGKWRRSPALPGLRFNGRLIHCFSLIFLLLLFLTPTCGRLMSEIGNRKRLLYDEDDQFVTCFTFKTLLFILIFGWILFILYTVWKIA